MFRWEETDFHVIVDDPLQRHPPGTDSQRVTNLLGDDNLALVSYYVRHGMTTCTLYNSICAGVGIDTVAYVAYRVRGYSQIGVAGTRLQTGSMW